MQTQKMIEQRKQLQLSRKTQKSEALKDQAKQLTVLGRTKKRERQGMSNLKSQEKDIKKTVDG
ncbi:MAG: hypothetical protein WDO19_12850 [Bacteroidota bacterium]